MKNATQIRYGTIDRALRRNPEGCSWQQLADACYETYLKFDNDIKGPPSRRTILEDIRRMRSGILGSPAPIEYKKGAGYYYADRSYMLNPEPIKVEDLATLLNLVDWAEQLTYGQLPAGFSDTIHRLATHLRTRVRAPDSSIQLDRPGGLDGRENMQPLHHAILSRTVVRINYEEYLTASREHTLSPYLLKEYNRRWFLVAYDHDSTQLWTFPLDRIMRVEEALLTVFHDAPGLQPLSWLDPIVGVIRAPLEEPVLIRLKTTRLQACYLRTKPLHRSQKEITTDEAAAPEFTLTLIPNPELEMQLLSLGENVEVVEPADLRKRMATRVQRTFERYK